jgi:hypothetical protein
MVIEVLLFCLTSGFGTKTRNQKTKQNRQQLGGKLIYREKKMVRGLLLLLLLLILWAVLLVLLVGTMEVTTVALQNFTLGFLLPSRSSEMLTSLVTE